MASLIPGDLACPVSMMQHRITEKFGEDPQIYGKIIVNGKPLAGHNGLDFAPQDWGTHEFWFVDDGTVDFAGPDAYGFGNLVRVKHSWGRSWYGHLSRIDVKVGQRVKRWQQGGLTGGTGNCYPPGFIHLHLGLKPNVYDGQDGYGGSVDPEPLINFFTTRPVTGTGAQPGTGPVLTPVSTLKSGNAEVIAPNGVKIKWKPSKSAIYALVASRGSIIEVGNVIQVDGGVKYRQCIMWVPESEDGQMLLKNV